MGGRELYGGCIKTRPMTNKCQIDPDEGPYCIDYNEHKIRMKFLDCEKVRVIGCQVYVQSK